jgi:hypothetical protein
MGLRRIDESPKQLSPDEWCRREMRKHTIQRWVITIIEIAFMAAVIYGMIYFFGEVHP